MSKILRWRNGDPVSTRMHGAPDDYRDAPSGIGPHAAEWQNKLHRLVYDLAAEVLHLRAALAAERAAREEVIRDAKIVNHIADCLGRQYKQRTDEVYALRAERAALPKTCGNCAHWDGACYNKTSIAYIYHNTKPDDGCIKGYTPKEADRG